MQRSASWWLLVCLSVVACSDDDKGQSEGAAEAADASTDADTPSKEGSGGKKSSGNAAKAGSGGAGGGKSTSTGSGEKSASPDAKDNEKDDEKSDSDNAEDDAKDDAKDDADQDKPAESDDGKKPEAGRDSDNPASPDAPASDTGKTDAGMAPPAGPRTDGDQLSVCSMIEGDCNQGLACQAPAGPFSLGRGFCSKICEQDDDCSGLAPEGTRYTCSTGPGTRTCEVACSGAEDSSCPAGLACVQTGARRRPVVTTDAGAPEVEGDAGTSSASAFEPVFHCRIPFEVSKIWEPCNDTVNVCGEGLRCASAFWFGGLGHCTRSCETDADCAKPESGSATPSCATLVPAFGETPAVKQCVLSCAGAADGCPDGLTCFEGPETRGEMGGEPTPVFAWCQ